MSERDRWLTATAALAARAGAAPVLEGAASALGSLLGDDRIGLGLADPVPVAAPPDADPLLLDELHHRLLADRDRRAGGVARTPPALVACLVEAALAEVEEVATALDPACGGGTFLVALAAALHRRGEPAAELLERVLVGIDVDPLAVAVSTAALTLWARSVGSDAAPGRVVVADALAHVPTLPPVDLVVGNPPFRSPVGAGGARRAAGGGRGIADDAARFLETAVRALAPGGAAALLVPRSTLAASSAAAARAAVREVGGLRALWLDEGAMFAGVSARVAGPVLVAGRAPARVSVLQGLPAVPVADVAASGLTEGWGPLLAAAAGVPAVDLGDGATVGDRWVLRAAHRDQHYLLASLVREHDERHAGCRRVLTTGLLDPLAVRWGAIPTRLGGRRWQAPCVDEAALVASGSLGERLAALAPSVLVATQATAVEAAVDSSGTAIASTPVISARGDDLWHLAALLSGPVAAAVLHTRAAGTGRAVGAVRVSVGDLRALPLPRDAGAWDEGAAMAEELSAAPSAAGWRRFGEVMAHAHGAGDEVVRWWWPLLVPRLPGVAAAASHPPPPGGA